MLAQALRVFGTTNCAAATSSFVDVRKGPVFKLRRCAEEGPDRRMLSDASDGLDEPRHLILAIEGVNACTCERVEPARAQVEPG